MSEIAISIPTWVIAVVLMLGMAHLVVDVVNRVMTWRLERQRRRHEGYSAQLRKVSSHVQGEE